MYECSVLADSLNPVGNRLTTVEVTYPRFIHAEVMTHRVFSRNTASSRAIPNEKLRQRVIDDTAVPVWWGKNQSGMQALEELSDDDWDRETGAASSRECARAVWFEARDLMLAASEKLAKIGLHKQICNRIIEPWMPITAIISATEWDGFFRQRCHPDAQPEMRRAAEAIRDAMQASTPRKLGLNEWHLPLVRNHPGGPDQGMAIEDLVKLSVARCARVSYLTHDGRRDPHADIDLYQRLVTQGHWSPLEHAAQASGSERCGNFRGFVQHRSMVDPYFLS